MYIPDTSIDGLKFASTKEAKVIYDKCLKFISDKKLMSTASLDKVVSLLE